MEKKKSSLANIEKLRLPTAFVALLFVGGVVLASFSYTKRLEKEQELETEKEIVDIVFVEEEPIKITPPVNEPEQIVIIPPSQDIIIDSNKMEAPPVVVSVLPPPILKPVITPTPVVIPIEIIEFPDVLAEFPGGIRELQIWINENMIYPLSSIEMNEQGRVYLSFVVERDGSISNISIERGISDALDNEAERVIGLMPNWKAGETAGIKVRTRCRLPIIFTLE